MDQSQLTWIAKFVWNIADDVFSDLYVRGKYRDVILPMVVLRPLDALMEPSKPAVLDMNTTLADAGNTNQDQALCQAASNDFRTPRSTLSAISRAARASSSSARFRGLSLDGFSPNVQEILECLTFRNQIHRLSKADALGTLIEKFLDPADQTSAPAPCSMAKAR